MAAPEQQVLETRLNELEELARNKMAKYPTLREGQAKDVETSLEQDFGGMRRVIRDLESLAEDQEWVVLCHVNTVHPHVARACRGAQRGG